MRTFIGLALALGFTGCLFADIEEIADGTPIASITPGSYPATEGFGAAMAGYAGQDDDGAPISRLIATAGPGTPQLSFDIWDGAVPGDRSLQFDGCEDVGDCETGSGADVTGIPRWGGQRDCVLSSSVGRGLPQEGILRVQCEGGDSPFTALPPRMGIDFGRSLAPLFLDHPLGIALIGAPGDGPGAIYRLEEDRPTATALPIPSELGLNDDARLGQRLATFDLGTNIGELNQAVLILAAAKTQRRVVAFIAGIGPEGVGTVALGCMDDIAIRAPSESVDQGGSIALADFDGNGFPEAVLGDPANGRVRIVSLMAFSPAMGCDGAPVPEVVIECSDLPQGLVESCGSFGAAVTTGDFNDDGRMDLAVGAPTSSAGGVANVGAVYVIPSGSDGLVPGGAQSIFVRGTESGDALGTSLTTVSTQLTGNVRTEPVASAPGSNHLYVLYCTGLPGDAYDNANRCLTE